MSEELQINMNKYAHIHTRVLFLRYKKDDKCKVEIQSCSLFKFIQTSPLSCSFAFFV